MSETTTAVRATLIVPGLFALAYVVMDDLQVATFAAFGGFATLVLASFGGTRRDTLLATSASPSPAWSRATPACARCGC